MARKKVVRKNDGGHAATNSSEEISASTPEAAIEASKEAQPSTPAAAEEEIPHGLPYDTFFPIVGIGASAGGLAAFEAFFENMPSDSETGIAFVLVQHLDPGHKSILSELVRRYTRMRVFEVKDGMTVEPNCTYIIPPNKDMALRNGKLHLLEPMPTLGVRLPIDFFFRSLAQDRGEEAICIVLSGTGSDGTLGLKAIKEAGGMVMVQESESATYDGMPRSAIATGMADYILPVKDMPAQLISYVENAFGKNRRPVVVPSSDITSWIQRIEILLRGHSGHDFSGYKQSTIARRIEKRMVVNKIDHLEQYVEYLRQNPNELETLFRELLIGVTSFFRDPEAFEMLSDKVIPRLFDNKTKDNPIRIWIPGCSTGEEAFSIAILLEEYLEKVGKTYNIQLFATDIDHEAIEKARAGLFPASIAADVTRERLTRYFDNEDDSYRIKKSIRDMIVFADQDVIKDPPFSKIDLLSCRNLLIYWEPSLQKKVFPLFHYSLKPGGFMFLGSSETIGEFTNLFESLDRKWKLFRRKEGKFLNLVADLEVPPLLHTVTPVQGIEGQRDRKTNIRDLTEKILIHDYAPASVLVNDRGDIIYVHGRTGRFFELPMGEINTNILRGIREGLRLELTTALRKAHSHGETVRYDGLRVKTNGDTQEVNLVVKPVNYATAEPGLFMVIFEEVMPKPEKTADAGKSVESNQANKDLRIVALERELRAKEEYLQTTIEELETANEELKSTNEEMQSTNEELQSTNEELETSKEELQSVNEELVTVNTELQQKIDELSRLNNDMNNLLAGTGIGTVFVDLQRRIVRFTPAITRVINMIQTDIGRPMSHIASNLSNYSRLEEDTQTVLDTLVPREAEVQTRNGLWFLMRILPYRTVENVIEGAVITFVEITKQKLLQDTFSANQDRFKSVVESSEDIIWSISVDYKLTMGNSSFFNVFRSTWQREITVGEPVMMEWMPRQIHSEWRARYQRVFSGETFHEEVSSKSPTGEIFLRDYAFSPIRDVGERVIGAICIGRDFSDRKRASEALQRLAVMQKDSNDAIIVYDLDGRILDWNPAAARMFGWNEAEARSMNIGEMVPDEIRPEAEAILQKLKQGQAVEPYETRRVTRGGKELILHLSATALVEETGKPYAIMTIQQEIPTQKD